MQLRCRGFEILYRHKLDRRHLHDECGSRPTRSLGPLGSANQTAESNLTHANSDCEAANAIHDFLHDLGWPLEGG